MLQKSPLCHGIDHGTIHREEQQFSVGSTKRQYLKVYCSNPFQFIMLLVYRVNWMWSSVVETEAPANSPKNWHCMRILPIKILTCFFSHLHRQEGLNHNFQKSQQMHLVLIAISTVVWNLDPIILLMRCRKSWISWIKGFFEKMYNSKIVHHMVEL